ncbi:hypothetical protein BD626DRAFT_630667 [Schizophyllum amplum]|uniref:Uncharacterized protein n=1 Tax=Schizophyllum amplum TaxID=97359 RepID=A0A550CCF3_9AGAR|nr:hypothetical protein BD626DRAFT_630667 [Auriculariopsis ampla]
MSEDLAQALMISYCGSVEEATRQMKDIYSKANIIGGIPDPKDTTIQKVELPGVGCHMRFWMATKRALYRSISATIEVDKLSLSRPIYRSWCQAFSVTATAATFAVLQGTEQEFVFDGKIIKRILLPTRGQPVQPAVDPTVLQELPLMVPYAKRHAQALALTRGRAPY